MMTDRYIEKSFLYLLAASLVLHAVVFVIIVTRPTPPAKVSTEPYMVDLQELPELKDLPPPKPREAPRKTAPRGETGLERPLPQQRPVQPFPIQKPQAGEPAPAVPHQREPGEVPTIGPSPREELFRLREREKTDVAKLFPTAGNLARLEEQYRKKYGEEVAEGETRFLNTDDILFGSFLRRFETAVYGVWRYPGEAARLGIEGVTPVRITFNRKGEIVQREILQSSGSKILDDEVLRTLDLIGPVGTFPRGYEKETFNLIAFFQYGITRGATRSLR